MFPDVLVVLGCGVEVTKKTHLSLSHMPKFLILNRSIVPRIGLYYKILIISG